MTSVPDPGISPQICPRCGATLPDSKTPSCPSCGMTLQQRPVWLSIIAALGATVLALAGLGLIAYGAIVELFLSSDPSASDTVSIWGSFIGAILCFIATSAILKWMKKPNR